MGEVRFMISEAAKQVKVESHVLRYWEEELNLEIGRTEMGHRYYTKDDIQLFRCIKKLKDEGMLQKSTDQEPVKAKSSEKPAKPEEKAASSAIKKAVFSNSSSQKKEPDKQAASPGKSSLPLTAATPDSPSGQKAESAALTVAQAEVIPITQLEQVRSLIGDVLTEVVTTNNETLKKDITSTVTQDVIREMDFMFQAKERQEEEHFRKLDCLIRQQQANRREAARENPFGKLKKLLT